MTSLFGRRIHQICNKQTMPPCRRQFQTTWNTHTGINILHTLVASILVTVFLSSGNHVNGFGTTTTIRTTKRTQVQQRLFLRSPSFSTHTTGTSLQQGDQCLDYHDVQLDADENTATTFAATSGTNATTHNLNHLHTNTYTVMTWNILAPVYASVEKYAHCSSLHLDWNQTRCPSIIQQIQSWNADIVCLQEVQINTWYSDLLPHFHNEYIGILQNVSKTHHPVACATLIKASKFHVIHVESRSRALLVLIQPKATAKPRANQNKMNAASVSSSSSSSSSPAPIWYVANVHLDARYDQDMTRYNQLQSILQRIQFHSHRLCSNYTSTNDSNSNSNRNASDNKHRQYHNNKHSHRSESTTSTTTTTVTSSTTTTTTTTPFIVLAGDFNMERTNPIYTILSTGNVPTYNGTSLLDLPQRNPFNAHRRKTSSSSSSSSCVTSTTTAMYTKFNANPFPFVPLRDVFQPNGIYNATKLISNNVVLRQTFTSGSILDYIWTSHHHLSEHHISNVVPWMVQEMGGTNSPNAVKDHKHDDRQQGKSPQRGQRQQQPRRRTTFHWPSSIHPSDHIPIGMQFEYHPVDQE
jgi:mRNA deadenylase 3'-5' endonuclease subunit Ccr4